MRAARSWSSSPVQGGGAHRVQIANSHRRGMIDYMSAKIRKTLLPRQPLEIQKRKAGVLKVVPKGRTPRPVPT